jgi:hypothetical protein
VGQAGFLGMHLINNFHPIKYFLQKVAPLDQNGWLNVVTPVHLVLGHGILANVAFAAAYASGVPLLYTTVSMSLTVLSYTAYSLSRQLESIHMTVGQPIESPQDFACQCGPEMVLGTISTYALGLASIALGLASIHPLPLTMVPPMSTLYNAAFIGASCLNEHNNPKHSRSEEYDVITKGFALAVSSTVFAAASPLASLPAFGMAAVSAMTSGAMAHSIGTLALEMSEHVVDLAGSLLPENFMSNDS